MTTLSRSVFTRRLDNVGSASSGVHSVAPNILLRSLPLALRSSLKVCRVWVSWPLVPEVFCSNAVLVFECHGVICFGFFDVRLVYNGSVRE